MGVPVLELVRVRSVKANITVIRERFKTLDNL